MVKKLPNHSSKHSDIKSPHVKAREISQLNMQNITHLMLIFLTSNLKINSYQASKILNMNYAIAKKSLDTYEKKHRICLLTEGITKHTIADEDYHLLSHQ